MTKEEIMEMEPGNVLNTLIAEKVMNWYVSEGEYSGKKYWNDENDYSPYAVADFKPSTDISAAWEVVEKVQKQLSLDFSLRRHIHQFEMKWISHFYDIDIDPIRVVSTTAAECICKSALIAVIERKNEG